MSSICSRPPVIVFDLTDIDNEAIAMAVLEEERHVPSWQRANVGGWHSAPDLSQRSFPPIRALMNAIVENVGYSIAGLTAARGLDPDKLPEFRFGLTSWAMVMRDGHYVSPHDHGDAHFSVAYYVDAGDERAPPSGRLAFLDPRRSGRSIPDVNLFPATFDIAPVTGSLVLFPGWLVHHVHAYRGERPRICVSANVTVERA